MSARELFLVTLVKSNVWLIHRLRIFPAGKACAQNDVLACVQNDVLGNCMDALFKLVVHEQSMIWTSPLPSFL